MEEFNFTEENEKKIKELFADETITDSDYVDKVENLAEQQIKLENELKKLSQ